MSKAGNAILINYTFDGKVEKVNYNVKGQASVIIKGIRYDLYSTKWHFRYDRINEGDSLIKQKNSMIIKIIRPNGDVITVGD